MLCYCRHAGVRSLLSLFCLKIVRRIWKIQLSTISPDPFFSVFQNCKCLVQFCFNFRVHETIREAKIETSSLEVHVHSLNFMHTPRKGFNNFQFGLRFQFGIFGIFLFSLIWDHMGLKVSNISSESIHKIQTIHVYSYSRYLSQLLKELKIKILNFYNFFLFSFCPFTMVVSGELQNVVYLENKWSYSKMDQPLVLVANYIVYRDTFDR